MPVEQPVLDTNYKHLKVTRTWQKNDDNKNGEREREHCNCLLPYKNGVGLLQWPLTFLSSGAEMIVQQMYVEKIYASTNKQEMNMIFVLY